SGRTRVVESDDAEGEMGQPPTGPPGSDLPVPPPPPPEIPRCAHPTPPPPHTPRPPPPPPPAPTAPMFERPQPAAPQPGPSPTRKRFPLVVILAVAASIGLGVGAFIVFTGGDDEVSQQDAVPTSLEVPATFAADARPFEVELTWTADPAAEGYTLLR